MLLQARTEEFYRKLVPELSRFSPGERFYSTRELVRRFKISYRVVAAVAERMEAEGLLVRRLRSGLYVHSATPSRSVAFFYVDWPNQHVRRQVQLLKAALKQLGNYQFSALSYRYQDNLLTQIKSCTADLIVLACPSREFSDEELTRAIAERLRPEGLRAELSLVFQSCEDLAHCCPEHRGDWYFTGNYPTPGGFRVVNRALVNYVENRDERAY